MVLMHHTIALVVFLWYYAEQFDNYRSHPSIEKEEVYATC